MTAKRGRGEGNPKRTVAAVLVWAFLVPAVGARERRGAQIIVTNLDGTTASGELLAVNDETLVIKDGPASSGVLTNLKDIRCVRIVRRSKIWTGLGKGALIGGGVGAGLGALSYDETGNDWFTPESRGQGALWGAAAGGLCGALLGAILGAAAGADEIVWVDTTSVAGIRSAAIKLSRWSKAR
jgi:hypothetical protein